MTDVPTERVMELGKVKLTRQRLRTMRDRWQRDYDTLESVYGDWVEYAEHDGDAYIETMRNLGTAIAWIDGMITSGLRRPALRSEQPK